MRHHQQPSSLRGGRGTQPVARLRLPATPPALRCRRIRGYRGLTSLLHLLPRHFRSSFSPDGGPPVIRSREHPLGLPNVSPAHARELAEANAIVHRTAAILTAACDAGAEYILDHPADRGQA
eukprot:6019941-Pleurochrysis_carterae.AAC.1